MPRVGAGFRLQWEPAQDCHVLLYPEGMVKLNQQRRRDHETLRRRSAASAAIVAELEQRVRRPGPAGRRAGLRRRWPPSSAGWCGIESHERTLPPATRPAAVAAGRADLPLPAALRVLLQPGRLCAPARRTLHRRLAARAARGPRTRRRAMRPVGRRAAAARRPGSDRRRSAPAGLLHQPADLGRRPHRSSAPRR